MRKELAPFILKFHDELYVLKMFLVVLRDQNN